MACLMIAARRLDTLCHASVVSAATRPPSPAVYRPYRNSPVLQRNRPYRYTTDTLLVAYVSQRLSEPRPAHAHAPAGVGRPKSRYWTDCWNKHATHHQHTHTRTPDATNWTGWLYDLTRPPSSLTCDQRVILVADLTSWHWLCPFSRVISVSKSRTRERFRSHLGYKHFAIFDQ